MTDEPIPPVLEPTETENPPPTEVADADMDTDVDVELCPLCPDHKPPSPTSTSFAQPNLSQQVKEIALSAIFGAGRIDLKWIGCTRCDDQWFHAVCLGREAMLSERGSKQKEEELGEAVAPVSNEPATEGSDKEEKKPELAINTTAVRDSLPLEILKELARRGWWWDYTKYIQTWYCPSCIAGETKTTASRKPKPKLREDLHIPALILPRKPPLSGSTRHPHAPHKPSPLSDSIINPDTAEKEVEDKPGARPKRKAALNQPDYHALHNSISTPTAKWLGLIADPKKTGRKISERPYKKIDGTQITKAWLDSTSQESDIPSPSIFFGANREPFLIPKESGFDSLGGKIPDAKLGFQDVANLVGREKTLDVIDVASQQSAQWTLGKWADYISEHRSSVNGHGSRGESSTAGKQAYSQSQKVYNVISLEISGTGLGRKVRPPKVVTDIDWVDRYWPDLPGKRKARGAQSSNHVNGLADKPSSESMDGVKEEDGATAKGEDADLREEESVAEQGKANYPKVQLYCLMGMKGSWTDWHVDFAASSVYYTVHTGAKTFFFIRPTDENLAAYAKWSSSHEHQDNVWLGDWCDEVRKVTLTAGDTMFIPSGYIHAVYTPADSLVFGGNFLHSYNVESQLQLRQIEIDTKVPQRFRFPFFDRLCWYAASEFCRELRDAKAYRPGSRSQQPSRETNETVLEGFMTLSRFLLKEVRTMEVGAGAVEEKKRKSIYDRIPHDRVKDPAGLARELKWRLEEAMGMDSDEEEGFVRKPAGDHEDVRRASKKRKLASGGMSREGKGSIVFAARARTKNFEPSTWTVEEIPPSYSLERIRRHLPHSTSSKQPFSATLNNSLDSPQPETSLTTDIASQNDLPEASQEVATSRQIRRRVRKAEHYWVEEEQEVVVTTKSTKWPHSPERFEEFWREECAKRSPTEEDSVERGGDSTDVAGLEAGDPVRSANETVRENSGDVEMEPVDKKVRAESSETAESNSVDVMTPGDDDEARTDEVKGDSMDTE